MTQRRQRVVQLLVVGLDLIPVVQPTIHDHAKRQRSTGHDNMLTAVQHFTPDRLAIDLGRDIDLHHALRFGRFVWVHVEFPLAFNF